VSLDVLSAALATDLPQQQQQLALLRRVAAFTSAQLGWQTACPVTDAGERQLTPQQRSAKALAHVSAWRRGACQASILLAPQHMLLVTGPQPLPLLLLLPVPVG
jgi:hypothetical protein